MSAEALKCFCQPATPAGSSRRDRLGEIDRGFARPRFVPSAGRVWADLRRKLEGVEDRLTDHGFVRFRRDRCDPSRAARETQDVVAFIRRQREPAAIDRIQERTRARGERRVGGGDVVRDAGKLGADETQEDRFANRCDAI